MDGKEDNTPPWLTPFLQQLKTLKELKAWAEHYNLENHEAIVVRELELALCGMVSKSMIF